MTIDNSNEEFYVQALTDWLGGPIAWASSAGTAVAVTYSFDHTLQNQTSYLVTGLSSPQMLAAIASMNLWSSVANITFSVDDISPELIFAQGEVGNAGTSLLSVGSNLLSRSETIIDDDQIGFSAGGDGYQTFIHEIGHALGISHPNGNEFEPGYHYENTAMSVVHRSGGFTSSSLFSSTPMVYDIAAIQFLYGANHFYNATSTVYDLSDSSTKVWTIWDGNGNDTLSAINDTAGALLDLREGVGSYNKVGDNVAYIAFGANIENAEGGTGDDTIIGNGLNNYLTGDSGGDDITGAAGNDTIDGGGDADFLIGGDGADSIVGGSEADSLAGGDGDDLLEGGADADKYYYLSTLAEGHDTINDGGSADRIYLDGVAIDEASSDFAFWALDETTLVLSKTTSEGYVTTLMLTNFESGDYDITFTMPDEYYADPGEITRIIPDSPSLPNNGVFYGTNASEDLSFWAKTVFGGGGNDYVANTQFYNPVGVDMGSYIAYPNHIAENIYLDGGEGSDVIVLSHSSGNHYNGYIGANPYSRTIQYIDKSAEYATVNGGSGNDTITGGSGFINAILNGGDGNDSITGGYEISGGSGNDTITAVSVSNTINARIASVYKGDSGNDHFHIYDAAADGALGVFDGGLDFDTISFSSNRMSTVNLITASAISYDFSYEEKFSFSFLNVEHITGSDYADTFYALF